MKYRRRQNTIEGQRGRDEGEGERNRGQIFQIPAWSTRKDPAILFRVASSRKDCAANGPPVYFSFTLSVRYAV